MLVASRRAVSRRAKCAKELDGRGFCLQLVFVGSIAIDRSEAMAGFGRRTVEARRARRRLNWAEQGARRGGWSSPRRPPARWRPRPRPNPAAAAAAAAPPKPPP